MIGLPTELLSPSALSPEGLAARDVLMLLLAAVCGITDAWKGKVYNAVTIPGILMGFYFNWLLQGAPGLILAGQGFLLGFAVFFFFFLIGKKGRAMSGGDVKLMGMVGAFAGPVFTIWAMFLGSLVGAFFAFAVLVKRGRLFSTLFGMARYAGAKVLPGGGKPEMPEDAKARIPYGFAITIGTFWAYVLYLVWGGLG